MRAALSVEDGRALLQAQKGTRRSKYNARKTTVDGIVFDSAKEARRYRELRLLEHARQIHGLTCQPRFELYASGYGSSSWVFVGTYVADFEYIEWATDMHIVEDVKSQPTKTALYRLKKKIAEACHGIQIREV